MYLRLARSTLCGFSEKITNLQTKVEEKSRSLQSTSRQEIPFCCPPRVEMFLDFTKGSRMRRKHKIMINSEKIKSSPTIHKKRKDILKIRFRRP